MPPLFCAAAVSEQHPKLCALGAQCTRRGARHPAASAAQTIVYYKQRVLVVAACRALSSSHGKEQKCAVHCTQLFKKKFQLYYYAARVAAVCSRLIVVTRRRQRLRRNFVNELAHLGDTHMAALIKEIYTHARRKTRIRLRARVYVYYTTVIALSCKYSHARPTRGDPATSNFRFHPRTLCIVYARDITRCRGQKKLRTLHECYGGVLPRAQSDACEYSNLLTHGQRTPARVRAFVCQRYGEKHNTRGVRSAANSKLKDFEVRAYTCVRPRVFFSRAKDRRVCVVSNSHDAAV
ncbi:unnamed protein product [Trichogramma brassicae]|uniref:Uncharacterized protein n=1 Tax=Trichogramma brassicae TaxID=86971 RepID=A0A6H5IBP9_9HYME|nr:unnamed protein product [Trichogramma brassicae]